MTNPPYRANSLVRARATLVDRLRVRQPEIEQAILTRMHAIADPSTIPDPEYLTGLRSAVLAAIDYGILSLEVEEKKLEPIPVPLLSQARVAARNGVGLNTVLRRCVSGYTLFVNFIEEEATHDGRCRHGMLKELRTSQVALLDRLLSALSDEHDRGNRDCPGSSQSVLTQRVQRLLAGEFVDTSEIPYDFDAHHVGIVAEGPAAAAVRNLARALDSRLLSISVDEDLVWAWLGTRDEINHHRMNHFIATAWPSTTRLALGEMSKGCTGWRLTHRQAKAAFSVSPEEAGSVARYADVALLASMNQDELLASSLTNLYLVPLTGGRDNGQAFRETLRAYFSSGRNSSSTAAFLGVTRQTVANRLRSIERRIGRPLEACAAEMEAALRLAEIKPTE